MLRDFGVWTLYDSITISLSRLHSVLCKIQNNYITFDIVEVKGQTYKTNLFSFFHDLHMLHDV